MGDKPTAATVLSAIGGVFILLGGLLWILAASLLGAFGGMIPGIDVGGVTGMFQILGAIGIVLGLVIIVLGVLMSMKPAQAKILGVLVLVLSIVSIFAGGGGFYLGAILGIVGGILGIVFKPVAPMMAPPMAPPPSM